MTTLIKEFHLSFAPNGSASSVAITEAQNVSIGSYRRLKIKQFTMPITYYAVSTINNAAELSENGGGWAAVTLTPGNYTQSTFATEVKTQLEATGAGTYTVSINTETSKMLISVGGGAATFSIRFTASNRQMEKIWGVPTGTARPQIPNGGSYTSTNIIQLWGPDHINLVSSTLVKMIASRAVDLDDASNMLLRVPINVNVGSQQTVYDEDWRQAVNQVMTPTTISIDIQDESGNSINLNGGVCYLTIAVSSNY